MTNHPDRRSQSRFGAGLLAILGAAAPVGVACLVLNGCTIVLETGPNPTPVPTARATPSPVQTPTPRPGFRQLTSGRVVLAFRGLARVPLRHGWDKAAAATLTYETAGNDRAKPMLELEVGGNTSAPCLQTPCRDLMGLIPRWSSSLKHDDTLDWSTPEAEKASDPLACGTGTNYHRRLALGPMPDGVLVVTVAWNADQLSVATPVDSVVWSLRRRGSFGLGRVVLGAPWPRREARGHLWDGFSVHPWASVEVLESGPVGEQLPLVGCP